MIFHWHISLTIIDIYHWLYTWLLLTLIDIYIYIIDYIIDCYWPLLTHIIDINHWLFDYYWLYFWLLCVGLWIVMLLRLPSLVIPRAKDDLDQLDWSRWCWSELPQSWDVWEVALATPRFHGRKASRKGMVSGVNWQFKWTILIHH